MKESINRGLPQLDGEILKLTAALSMLIDHTGAILFPEIMGLRIVGRIALPIFVFFIAEGCRYTSNKSRYLFNLCGFGVITQIVKTLFNDTDDFNIMFTFAIAAAAIFIFQNLADSIKKAEEKKTIYLLLIFAVYVAFIVWLNSRVIIQYGFWGCMAPLIVYLSEYADGENKNSLKTKLVLLSATLLMIYMVYGGVQIYEYAAVLLLIMYSGRKGNKVPKYFFYTFYPAHLALLYVIKMFM